METISKIISKARMGYFLWAVFNIVSSQAAFSNDKHAFSDAEKILWLTDQLSAIDKALELTYKFEKTSSLEEDFSDKITFTITGINEDGSKAAKIDFPVNGMFLYPRLRAPH